jgi:RimJ/RimL family protein N-acetyltransferase
MELAAATLANAFVRLEPFEPRHRDGLIAAAHADASIFAHMPFPIAERGYGAWFDWLVAEQAAGRWLAFAVVALATPTRLVIPGRPQAEPGTQEEAQRPLRPWVPDRAARVRNDALVQREDGNIVGQSCYLNIRAHDAGVEIGGTWYRREAQGSAINPAAKLLLLRHAFACGAERVEFKTDALNLQSRAALTKLGATFEGIFRRQMRRPNGTMRDNAYFSVIREEWAEVKTRIEARLAVSVS